MVESESEADKKLRQALGTFATGVTVVTTIDGEGQPRGFTANSFTSVSLNPPLLLVCLATDASSCPVFSAATNFCVNILAETQQGISHRFASSVRDRFEDTDWHLSESGCPIIDDVISWFDCEMHEVTKAGDHVILIGKIIGHDFNGRSPLVFCSGSYVEFGLAQRAMELVEEGSATRVSAVINCDGYIPMERFGAKLSLPAAARVGNATDSDSLIGRLVANGIHGDMPFVFAVYEDIASRTQNVVYRGSGETGDLARTGRYEFVRLDQLPWDAFIDDPLRTLLRRYIEENDRDAFGVYVGDTEKGAVHALGARR